MGKSNHDALPFGLDEMLKPDYPDNLMRHAFLMDDDLRLLLSRVHGEALEKPKTGTGVFDPSFEIIW